MRLQRARTAPSAPKTRASKKAQGKKRVRTKPATSGQISVALTRARKDKGMTITEVCEQVNFNRSQIMRVEKGNDNNPTRMRTVALALALVYGLEPADVLERPDA